MIDLDILNETEFEFCVRCYAPEGKYGTDPFQCLLIVDGDVSERKMKLPHHGRKVVKSGK